MTVAASFADPHTIETERGPRLQAEKSIRCTGGVSRRLPAETDAASNSSMGLRHALGRPSSPRHGDTAADVAGQRPHLLERRRLHLVVADQRGQPLSPEPAPVRCHGETEAVAVVARHQRLEYLLGHHADLGRKGPGSQVTRHGEVVAYVEAARGPAPMEGEEFLAHCYAPRS
jgi:hypothetical protein